MADSLYTNTFKSVGAEQGTKPESHDWWLDDVVHPFINGTGVVQVYDTFANKQVATEPVAAPANKVDWAVQTISSAAGAIIPYVAMGKLAGFGLRSASETWLKGAGARAVAGEIVPQILGAGLWDGLKKPADGETRAGNVVGSVLGFAVFGGGNKLLAGVEPQIGNAALRLGTRYAGRAVVGAVGGGLSYESSNEVAGFTGGKNQATQAGLESAFVSGGFTSVVLPDLQKGANKLIDLTINDRSWGKGVPVDRAIARANLSHDEQLGELAKDNALARVKRITADDTNHAGADTKRNVVRLQDPSNLAKMAHELMHLKLAKDYEPQYKEIAAQRQTEPAVAELRYYRLRAKMEQAARQAENSARARGAGNDPVVEDPEKIGDISAANGLKYNAIWRQEWQNFQKDPSFRPQYEYADPVGTSILAKPATDAVTNSGVPADFGFPEVWGTTVTDAGINFALPAPGATGVDLLIFPDRNAKQPSQVLPMYKTGDVFHRFVPTLPNPTLYLERVYGEYSGPNRFNGTKVILDPMATAYTGDIGNKGTDALGYDNSDATDGNRFAKPSTIDNVETMPRAVAYKSNFDWGNDKHPETPLEESIGYEAHVKGFTAKDGSLPVDIRGTYEGIKQKAAYLKQQGYTFVELMPVFKFDKSTAPGSFVDPVTGEKLGDAWGYNPLGFKAPETRYASSGNLGQQVDEFKSMVKALHEQGIEVVLDVVFNHTGEAGKQGITVNLKGMGNDHFYILDPNNPQEYVDKTGCGNTLNTNDPVTQEMIMQSLRYWVQEMHVDGFRFDLATIFNFMKDEHGNVVVKDKTPIISAMENDPVLAKTKLIAEPWGASADSYRLGHFSDQRWGEWNGQYRDTVRSFEKGDEGQAADLVQRIMGSPSWFDDKKGRFSVNIVTAHDGFTLYDLVSYNTKHNWRDGEGGNSGNSSNLSWNSGAEGPTDDPNINALRTRRMKNMSVIQMLSRGMPQDTYGDELRRTQNGNNNAWNHDDLIDIDWDEAKQSEDMQRFKRMVADLRQTHKIGYATPDDYNWRGADGGILPDDHKWQPTDHLVSFTLDPAKDGVKPLYAAINSWWEPIKLTLPPGQWARLVDTNLPAGQDIVEPANSTPLGNEYWIQPRSAIVLQGVDAPVQPAPAAAAKPAP